MDGRRSIDRIVSTLREIDADVVCLQEFHRYQPGGGMEDQPRILSQALVMGVEIASGLRLPWAAFGNAVLCRWPMRMAAVHVLPNAGERRRASLWLERRTALEVEVQTPVGPFTIFNTHGSLDPVDRLASSERLSQRIRALSGPLVVCGDLNARADSPEFHALLGAGLSDGGAADGTPTYPADSPRHRIDYILTRGVHLQRLEVIAVDHSDHRPVVAEIAFETP